MNATSRIAEGDAEDRQQRVDRAATRIDPLAPTASCTVDRGPDPEQRREQRQDQCSAADDGHQLAAAITPDFAGLYFDGHFVTIDPDTATNPDPRLATVTISSRPTRKGSGTAPV